MLLIFAGLCCFHCWFVAAPNRNGIRYQSFRIRNEVQWRAGKCHSSSNYSTFGRTKSIIHNHRCLLRWQMLTRNNFVFYSPNWHPKCLTLNEHKVGWKSVHDINLVPMNGRWSATYDVCCFNFITLRRRFCASGLDASIILLCKINKALTTFHPICHHLHRGRVFIFSFFFFFSLSFYFCQLLLARSFAIVSILFHFMYLVFSSSHTLIASLVLWFFALPPCNQ